MATRTTNFGLYKPDPTDDFGDFLPEFNANMDEIDDHLGGGGGSSTLAGLSDVNLTSPITGDALIYDGAEWVNSPLSAVAFSGDYSDLLNTPTIPTKVSDLTNDSGFITNTVNNLTNYYLKSETYTQAEINALIAGIVTLNVLVVQSLPTTNISTTTIYLVPKTTAGTQDVYDEYLNLDGTTSGWEHIGTTEIDLSNYYTKTQVDTLLADKVDKVSGKGLSTEDYTTAEKNKLAGIASGAEVNVQSDWNQSNNAQDDYIKNKPTKLSDFTNDSGFITGVDVSDIGDVDLNNLANGQVLKYNSTNQKWENQNESGGGGSYTEGDGIDITNNAISVDTTFTEAGTRANIDSGDTFSTILGKIKKWFTDIPNLFVDKTGDTMSGNLSIDREDGTTSTQGYSRLYLGNNIPARTNKNSAGLLRLYGTGNKRIEFYDNGVLTADRTVNFQDKSGVMALTSDLEPLNKHINIKPSTTGKSTLLQYIIDVVSPMSTSTYSFSADTFPDLPTNDWGYDVTVHNQGGLYVTAERQLSNGTIYVRGINANSAWVDSWKTLATTSDIPDISTKVSKSGDTMTGQLTIQSSLNVGYSGGAGEINLYNTNLNICSLRPSANGGIFRFPNTGGTLALTSDLAKVYSTTEKKIGKWIDNKDLYEKTVELTSLSAGGEMTKNHGINNISQVCHWQAVFLDTSGGNECNNWLPNAADWSCFVQNVSRTAVGYYMGGSRLPYISKLIVTVQYTKTS